MAETSTIEWTDATWNVVTGCTRVSPGCAHCYIEKTPPFRISGRKFERVGNEETTGLVFHPERLELPLRWRRPRRVFVNSLSDLFHEEIEALYIADVFATMALARRHTFQVLTKRPERARELLTNPYWWANVEGLAQKRVAEHTGSDPSMLAVHGPLPNVWVGVSIENARYTWRADVLREIPAPVRFLSCEPLLGSLFPPGGDPVEVHPSDPRAGSQSELNGPSGSPTSPPGRAPLDLAGIDWVIVGGESGGRESRPMHPDWARELRDACEFGPAFFFKQWGSHDEHGVYKGASPKSGGRLLDGKTWDETP